MSNDFKMTEFVVPPEKLRGPRIAILSRAMFSYHSRVLWGFLKKLELVPESNWRPIMFFCKEPQVNVMQAQMKEIATEKYDLILSIGALYSKVAADYVREHALKTPMIFCGVADPVHNGVIQKLTPENGITGIMREQLPPTYLADFLLLIKPSIKRVLIPNYPMGEFGHSLAQLRLLVDRFKIAGVETVLLPVYAMTDVVPGVMAHIARVDSIILPEGTFVAELTGILAKLCKEYRVTLVSHHREQQGAHPAITFTQSAEAVGEALFHRACEVVIEQKVADHLPIIVLPNDRQIIVDTQACSEQGVDLDAITLLCSFNNIIIK